MVQFHGLIRDDNQRDLMSITSNNKGKAPRIPLKDELDYEHASISAL